MSIFVPIAVVAVSAYICYRVLRSCEELANDWSAETDLRYSHPSLVQNYYGEEFDEGSDVGEEETVGERGPETREAGVPECPQHVALAHEAGSNTHRQRE